MAYFWVKSVVVVRTLESLIRQSLEDGENPGNIGNIPARGQSETDIVAAIVEVEFRFH